MPTPGIPPLIDVPTERNFAMDLTRYRTQLIEERVRLQNSQAVLTEQQGTSIAGHRVVDVDDASPQDPAEIGEQLIERATVLDELVVLDAELLEVAAALDRLETGQYGRCEDCGEPIPDERLSALPTARRCAPHQRLAEGGGSRLTSR